MDYNSYYKKFLGSNFFDLNKNQNGRRPSHLRKTDKELYDASIKRNFPVLYDDFTAAYGLMDETFRAGVAANSYLHNSLAAGIDIDRDLKGLYGHHFNKIKDISGPRTKAVLSLMDKDFPGISNKIIDVTSPKNKDAQSFFSMMFVKHSGDIHDMAYLESDVANVISHDINYTAKQASSFSKTVLPALKELYGIESFHDFDTIGAFNVGHEGRHLIDNHKSELTETEKEISKYDRHFFNILLGDAKGEEAKARDAMYRLIPEEMDADKYSLGKMKEAGLIKKFNPNIDKENLRYIHATRTSIANNLMQHEDEEERAVGKEYLNLAQKYYKEQIVTPSVLSQASHGIGDAIQSNRYGGVVNSSAIENAGAKATEMSMGKRLAGGVRSLVKKVF